MEFDKNGEIVPDAVVKHLHIQTLYEFIVGGFVPDKGMTESVIYYLLW